MKRSLLALLVSSMAFSASAVTYHQPSAEMEANLNAYGTGVETWEEKRFVQFTMADAHLYHDHAMIKHGDAMPLKVVGGLDVSKILLDDVRPGKQIPLYDVMRDRASISSYVVMNNNGDIVAEDYWNGTDKDTLFHIMSSHKSFTSMLAAIGERNGLYKMTDKASKYVPELRGTKWEDVTIQNFADMTSGIVNLPSSREGYHWASYAAGASGSWDSAMPSVLGYNGHVEKDGKVLPKPDSLGELKSFSEYLTYFANNIEPAYPQGEVYEYKDLNTEILGQVIVRSSGKTLSEFMEENLWTKGGFTSDSAMYTNYIKESAASGSFNVTTRDFAIGSYLMAHGGKNWKGEQVLPEKYVKEVLHGDEKVKEAWNKISYEAALAPDAFYKNQWRTVTHPETGRVISTMIGVNGQYSAFDHKTGNVIALTGNYREPSGQQMAMLYLFETIYTIFETLDK